MTELITSRCIHCGHEPCPCCVVNCDEINCDCSCEYPPGAGFWEVTGGIATELLTVVSTKMDAIDLIATRHDIGKWRSYRWVEIPKRETFRGRTA